jgi:hypothetical protein
MKKQLVLSHIKQSLFCMLAVILLLPASARAFMDEVDREKPAPEFAKKGNTITAKLIPRAKNTSVTIDFEVTGGGNLVSVKSVDFADTVRPEIDPKDFRSELFAINIEGVAPGGEVTLTASSSFFSTSTQYWLFNEYRETPWMDSQAKNNRLEEKVRQLSIRIKDGGEFDSDSEANGKLTLIGGPKDSFWGYVLGTLFIRFFGVFIVLSILMIGMLISGLIFQKMEKKSAMEPHLPESVEKIAESPSSNVTPEMAAAVGMAIALHLRQSPAQASDPVIINPHESSAWAVDGRRRMMTDRLTPFNRIKH